MPPSLDGGIVVYGIHPGDGRQQGSLFPPTLKELVPEDHRVRQPEAVGPGQWMLPDPTTAGARTELALAVNAYNLKLAISMLGARRLFELMG